MTLESEFFFEDNKKSMSRLCMWLGTWGGILLGFVISLSAIWYPMSHHWLFYGIPFSVMLGGCLPYIFNTTSRGAKRVLTNPDTIAQIAEAISKVRGK